MSDNPKPATANEELRCNCDGQLARFLHQESCPANAPQYVIGLENEIAALRAEVEKEQARANFNWVGIDTEKARADAAEAALFKCYTYSGAEAGDEDDFRALVNKCDAVPDAVLDRREISDAAETRVAELEKALEGARQYLLDDGSKNRLQIIHADECNRITAALNETPQ